MKKVTFLLLCLSVLLGAACRKDKIELAVFRELPRAAAEDLSAVWFTDSLHGVVTGGKTWQGGFILSTSDGGENWMIDTVLANKMECVMFDREGQGYVCGLDGLLLHRPPGGAHWYVFRVDWRWHRACYFPDSRRGVVVSGEGYRNGQVRCFGPEAFWQFDSLQVFPNELHAVWFSDSATVHAAGYGWMMRSDDGGYHWERLPAPGDFYRSVHFPTPQTGYACGYQGTLLKTTNGGRSWQTIREGGSSGHKNRPFRALWFADAERGWLVGEQGIFWSTTDGGRNWQLVAGAPADANFTDVFVRDGGKGWITAEEGRIFYFEQR